MEMRNYICLMSVWTLIVSSCKKPYSPPAITVNNNYLVVEGVIDAGTDSTVIKLSRTVNLSGQTALNPEKNATVTVQGDQNASYSLSETAGGRYVSAPLNLDNTHKYRLFITTADGRIYASNYEGVKETPPIDTLGYMITNDGLSLYINTHDPANNTHYYRWDYAETYLYFSPLTSYYKYIDYPFYYTQRSVRRLPSEYINTCYITNNSTTVLLNSSAKLAQDMINQTPITQVPKDSEKIFYRYTINVKQYALTPEAYEFWTLLKKNTEKLGTIFDPQPSEAKTNLYCVSNPSEPVIGYMSVSTVSQKRIFIDRTELPVWPFSPPECNPLYASWMKKGYIDSNLPDSVYIPLGPIESEYIPALNDTAYSVKVGYYDCVDCRYHLHGKTQKPAFWK